MCKLVNKNKSINIHGCRGGGITFISTVKLINFFTKPKLRIKYIKKINDKQ